MSSKKYIPLLVVVLLVVPLYFAFIKRDARKSFIPPVTDTYYTVNRQMDHPGNFTSDSPSNRKPDGAASRPSPSKPPHGQ